MVCNEEDLSYMRIG